MAIQATEKIWHNGKLIPWNDAQIHVMAHVVNYGSSVFEGIRCYAPEGKPAIFRLRDHMQRLIDSAKDLPHRYRLQPRPALRRRSGTDFNERRLAMLPAPDRNAGLRRSRRQSLQLAH